MTSPLELWITSEAGSFGLELARMTGVIAAAPLAWAFAPVRVKAALIVLTTLVLHGPLHEMAIVPSQLTSMLLALVAEVGLGLCLGFCARLALGVGEIAADSIAPAMGLGAAQMFDPTLGGQGTVLSKLLRYVALLVALTTGLHHILLGALFHSFRVVPPGTLFQAAELTPSIQTMVSETLLAGVTLALPFLAVLLITQLSLAFVARAAPQMQIFSVGFAVTLGTGALLWMVFAPDVVVQLSAETPRLEQNIERLLSALGGRP
jgi:flagellar biosynthesis protein FliR